MEFTYLKKVKFHVKKTCELLERNISGLWLHKASDHHNHVFQTVIIVVITSMAGVDDQPGDDVDESGRDYLYDDWGVDHVDLDFKTGKNSPSSLRDDFKPNTDLKCQE